MMLSVHGWSPIGDEDEDVVVSYDTCLISISPYASPSKSTFFGPGYPPLDASSKPCSPLPQPTSVASSTRTSRPSIPTSSDRRAQRNRHRDPSWIPRPRNAFIIFRCEFSQEHSQIPPECDDDDDSNLTAKSLSKRAAEAWKELPQSEKDRYKDLADREKEAHARLYPHYRFRPMKRQASGVRKPSRERSPIPRVTMERRASAPSRLLHRPSVLSPAPDKPCSPPIEGQTSMAYQAEHQAPLSIDHDNVILSLPKPILSSNNSPSSGPLSDQELYTPPCMSPAAILPDMFNYVDFAANDLPYEAMMDPERGQAVGAYTVGLYDSLMSQFSFPDYR